VILSDHLPQPPYMPSSLLPRLIRSIFYATMRMPNLTDAPGGMSLSSPHRILVVGCAYGGIAATVNLLELANGKARQPIYPGPDFKGAKSRRGVEVTVIDERDGYCASLISLLAPLAEASNRPCRRASMSFSAADLVLTGVFCSPRSWSSARPCGIRLHKSHVEALLASE
jgi:hypothetical protein